VLLSSILCCVMWWLVLGVCCGGWCGWVLVGVRLCCVAFLHQGAVCDVNHVKDDVGFGCHLFLQLVICHCFSVDIEVFSCV
jgi:hypothetical protein